MSIESAIARLAPRLGHFAAGHVWLAGAGPGSVGCLTLEVVAALDQADAVVYDALFDTAVLPAAAAASLHFVGKRATTDNERLQVADLETVALRASEAGVASPARFVIDEIVAQRNILLAATAGLHAASPRTA